MKKQTHYLLAITFMAFALGFSSCAESESEMPTEVAPDMEAVKVKIQEKETAYAAAQTAKDVEAILAIYADDAVTMGPDKPVISGKEAIRKDVEENIAQSTKGSVTTFEVQEVFGSEELVTEIGTSTVKDSTDKVISTGKYMAIWEKRNGEYICIRDIYSDNAKEK